MKPNPDHRRRRLLGANLMRIMRGWESGLGNRPQRMRSDRCRRDYASGSGKLNPRALFITAALTDVDWCESHPEETWRCNVDASRTLAQIARGSERAWFTFPRILFSTAPAGTNGEADEPRPERIREEPAGSERACLRRRRMRPSCEPLIYGWNLLRPKRSSRGVDPVAPDGRIGICRLRRRGISADSGERSGPACC
jgi:hypothetical protein